MGAIGEKLFEAGLGLRHRVGPRHTDSVEAAVMRLRNERGLDRVRIA
jgi:hypothetical protein